MNKSIGIFLIGGPGSGKDYVLKNIFSRFELTEVQADQILNGAAAELFESNKNIVINGANDANKIELVQNMLEGYTFDFVHVSVTNKVSRLRNEQREQPISESKRIDKYLKAEQLAKDVEAFIFNNSINLNESSEMEKVFFGSQIEKLLERIVELGLEIKTTPEAKSFLVIKEKYFPAVAKHKSGLPKKYVGKLSDSTAAARKAHWKKMSKYSDKDPRAYKPAPGDATSKTKPSKHTLAVRKMMGEQMVADVKPPHGIEDIAAKHNVSTAVIIQALALGKQVEMEHTNDERTAEIIALGHLWEKPDYYDMLKQMEQKVPMTPQDHIDAERKDQVRRDRRDWRILHHQNRHMHKAAIGEAEDLPKKLRRVPRSGNITAVMNKRQETGRVNEEAGKSLSAKAKTSGISVGTLRKVYNRGVAAWNSGHRPGTTPQQWGHARVNSYINKGKTYHTADKDLREDADIDELFEMQLIGTDEYRKHAIAMTPGQNQEIEDAFPVKSPNKKPIAVVAKPGKSIVSQYTEHAKCGTPDCCGECSSNDESGRTDESRVPRSFRAIRETPTKKEVDITPTLATKKKKGPIAAPRNLDSTMQGLPVASRFSAYEETELDEGKYASTIAAIASAAYQPKVGDKIRTRHGGQIPGEVTKVTDTHVHFKHPEGKTYKTSISNVMREEVELDEGSCGSSRPAKKLTTFLKTPRKLSPSASLQEAVEYHLENKISFTENIFRPGSEMFFEMVSEAKRLYAEGKYTPTDEYELDMLNSDIGEIAEFEGQTVVLDYPIEEGLEEACWTGYTQKGMKKKGDKMVPNCVPVNEEDKTDGKGIGKPWREGGGGAVYVRSGDGGVKKVRFSQSGMKKKFMDPAATRSFVARHHCLTNKDKTSASYWACRYPRFFSNSGKTWW